MTKDVSKTGVTAALCVLLTVICGPAAGAEQSDTLSKIRDVWRARGDSIQSVSVKWQSTIDHRKYDETVVGMNEFVFDQAGRERARLQLVDVVNSDLEDFDSPMEVTRDLFTDNGLGRQVHFFPSEGSSAEEHSYASICPLFSMIRRDVRWRPLQLTLLPFHSDCGLWRPDSPDEFVVEGMESSDGTPCSILQMGEVSCWFTADDRMLLVEYRAHEEWTDENGKRFEWIDQQVTFDYDRDPDDEFFWIPTGWHRLNLNLQNEIWVDNRCEVTECRVNFDPDDSLFDQQEFPHGTWVSDQSGGELVDYLVRDGRPNRIISRQEGVDDYDHMMATDAYDPERRIQEDSRPRHPLILINVAILILLTAVWLFRRWRSGRSSVS